MNENAFPLPPRSLIEHQDFVRSLSRSLLRDEHDADDAAQDAWLAYLKHPPAGEGTLRGWFSTVTRNNVRNHARETSRRATREQHVARSEVDDSETELRERLGLQQKVVAAVMSLKEPYRSVILLAYYEGLSSAEIARRRDVPAGTVRAQVSRALKMLRDTLDRDHDGERKTWSVGLLACLPHSKTTAFTTGQMMLVATGVIVAATVGASAWVMSAPSRTPERITIESTAGSALPSTAVPTAASTPLQPPVPAPSTRVAAVPATSEASTGDALNAASLDDLVTMGRQIQMLLRERLLTPDPSLLAARSDLRRSSDTHASRIWQRGALGAEQNNVVGVRGAGAYLSFANGSQDYDDAPDLQLEGYFSSGFHGNNCGLVLDAGRMRLSDVGTARPASIDADAWQALWEPSHAGERTVPAEFGKRIRGLQENHRAGVAIGHVYFVRSVLAGEHDLAAAFEVLAKDDQSASIAWRVLQRNEVPTTGGVIDRKPVTPEPPPDLKALTTEKLRARFESLMQIAQERILGLPKSLDPAIARYAKQRDGGLARIAERGMWSSILSIDGAGAYWSFTRRSNDYQQEAQIELEQGKFTSGFAGRDAGYVVRLGALPLEAITSDDVIPGLDSDREECVKFLRNLVPVRRGDNSAELEVSDKDRARAGELGLRSGSAANVGDSYLVRCVQTGNQDVLAAFQVVAKDEAALTIAWKILRQSPASR